MKKQIKLVVIIVIVFILFLCGCQESTEDNNISAFSKYVDAEKGFSVEYPSGWNKYENPTEVPDVDVLFVSPSNEPTKSGNLMITVIDNVSMTMDDFKRAHVENLSIVIPNFNIISENTTTLSDLSGYELIYTFTNDIYIWRQQEIWTINENKLYMLVHQVDQEYYENFTSDIEHMVESFSIINSDDVDKMEG